MVKLTYGHALEYHNPARCMTCDESMDWLEYCDNKGLCNYDFLLQHQKRSVRIPPQTESYKHPIFESPAYLVNYKRIRKWKMFTHASNRWTTSCSECNHNTWTLHKILVEISEHSKYRFRNYTYNYTSCECLCHVPASETA